MKQKEFEEKLEKFEKESQYFHEDTCSATYHVNEDLSGYIVFRDSDLGTRMHLNIADAAYIFDSFLDTHQDKAIEFFNRYLDYRALKIRRE